MNNDLVLYSADLIENPSPRVPVVLCLDTSGSMSGDPIRELAQGVAQFYSSIYADEIARFSAEIAIVTFGANGVSRLADFGPVEEHPRVVLQADGLTPMGEGIGVALDMLEERKRQYKEAGVDYYQPWLVIMTDGGPTDDVRASTQRLITLTSNKKLSVFPIGIGAGADMATLQALSPGRTALRLRGLEFGAFFEWLSSSVQRVSASTPGQEVPLDVDGIRGWGAI